MENCGCGHCDCDETEKEAENPPAGGCGCGHAHGADEQADIARLMRAIEEAGFKTAETPDGDIKISE